MELYLVRHGESLSTLGLEHSPDTALSPAGEEQADLLGKRLAGVRFDRIYASHLKRAVQTAAAVARHQPGEPEIVVVPELAERGTPLDLEADVAFHRSVYPNLVYTKTAMETDYHGDLERAEAALELCVYRPAFGAAAQVERRGETEIRSNPERVLITAHGGFNACLLSSLIGFRFDVNRNIVQHNTCVNRFKLFLYNGVPRIRFISYNDVEHLPARLRPEKD